ncbi:MAG: hypothetical protein QW228_05735 [Candidatus Aenigmatarchaeota archaeon]
MDQDEYIQQKKEEREEEGRIRGYYEWLEEKAPTEGKCVVCGELTNEKKLFSDDGELGYWDWCHSECYEYLKEKL